MTSDEITLDKKTIKNLINSIESKNGNKIDDFSVKEILLMTHKDTKKEIETLRIKLDSNYETNFNIIREHEKIIQKIIDELKNVAKALPEKGFCESVNNSLFPKNDSTLVQKVDLLWHDRRWIKYIIYAIFTLGIGNIILQILC